MFTNTAALLKQTYADWSEHKGPRLGAALAYYAIFSIPPLLMISIAAIGLVYSGNIVERLQGQLATLVGEETAKTFFTGIQTTGPKTGLIVLVRVVSRVMPMRYVGWLTYRTVAAAYDRRFFIKQ